jgi:hypothetical protein
LDEITIPFHLAIPTIISGVALGIILNYRKKLFLFHKLAWASVAVFLTIYFLIVGSATYEAIYFQWDLNRYDLNKDGLFGGQEITNESQAAMQRLTNDVGRNFSFITGFIFAGVISITIYVLGRLLLKYKKVTIGK